MESAVLEKPAIDPKSKVMAKFAAKSAGKAKSKGKPYVTGLTLGGALEFNRGKEVKSSMTSLSQTRKPPTMKALTNARGMAPFLIRSF